MNEYTENYSIGFSAGYRHPTDWTAHDEVAYSPDSPVRDAWLDGFNAGQDVAHPQYHEDIL